MDGTILRSELLQTLGTVGLVQLNTVGELLLEPGKVVDQGSRVAEMALAHTLQLGIVLDSLGISDGRAGLGGVVLAQCNGHGQVGAGTQEELLVVGLEGSGKSAQVVKDGLVGLDGDLRTKVLADLGRDGLLLEVEVDIVGGDDGIGEENGVAVDIGAAQVEQPGNLVKARNDESGNVLLLEVLAQLLDLLGVGAAGGLGGEGEQLGGRASGTVLPDQIDQVMGHRDQRRSNLGEISLQLVGVSYKMTRKKNGALVELDQVP